MLTSWRVVKTREKDTAFDGEGARLYGGRWNSPGTRIVYTSETLALAILEVLVHLQRSAALASYSACAVHFDESLTQVLDLSRLPNDWRRFPAPAALQRIGDEWINNQGSVVLKVPSAIIERESNYLLNPEHPDFGSLTIEPWEPLEFDRRLFGGAGR